MPKLQDVARVFQWASVLIAVYCVCILISLYLGGLTGAFMLGLKTAIDATYGVDSYKVAVLVSALLVVALLFMTSIIFRLGEANQDLETLNHRLELAVDGYRKDKENRRSSATYVEIVDEDDEDEL